MFVWHNILFPMAKVLLFLNYNKLLVENFRCDRRDIDVLTKTIGKRKFHWALYEEKENFIWLWDAL